jgi:drug/metabolite transporter (DMT)-like permease
MLTCWFGTWVLLKGSLLPGISLQPLEWNYIIRRVAPLSTLFCTNIVLGNISLQYIPVSFNQTIKAAVPACTVLLQTVLMLKKHPTGRYWSIIPIVGGVMLATYTEVNFHPIGFWTAVLGCFVTASWAIVSGVAMVRLNPVCLIYYMAPWSAGMLLLISFFHEYPDMIAKHGGLGYLGLWNLFLLFLSGAFALLLNVSSFFVINKTSPLTYTVSGNVKVALSVVISVAIFHNEITLMNGVGCGITILGVAWYQSVKDEAPQPTPSAPTSTPEEVKLTIVESEEPEPKAEAHKTN